ncbi:hypothetical protein ABZT02_29735 [Streptomyces sp. NPDC005402]|uniref:hypothetical protein n=1 Tax=Streptomyces sp. NPDC005402 TaxID=3155338 RepID=UPI0033AF411F
MSRFARTAYGSDSAMRRNGLLTYGLSAVMLIAGIMMIGKGIPKGWICVGLAVLYTGFVLVAMRVKARRGDGR